MLIHGLAIAAAVATYLLILIGGLVHGTGSSLACPDWPTCYGTMMPKMEGGVLVEHSHRLAAGTVVILTLVLAALITRSRAASHRRLRRVASLAVGLVVAQALLGGITVLLRLPTPVSTMHTAFRCCSSARCSISRCARPGHRAAGGRARARRSAAAAWPPARGLGLALVSAVAVYFQMVLGGLVRHSGAALACPDLPLCRGAVWPDAHPTVLVQVLHRLGALTVAWAGAGVRRSSTFRAARGRAGLRALAVVGPVLVVCADWLGVLAIRQLPGSGHRRVAPGGGDRAAGDPGRRGAGLGRARRPGRSTAAAPRWSLARALRDLIDLTKPRITGLVVATFAGGDLAGARAPAALAGGDDPDRHRADRVGARTRFNMFLERDQDRLMERTRRRPLPEGRLSPEAALVFGTALAPARRCRCSFWPATR